MSTARNDIPSREDQEETVTKAHAATQSDVARAAGVSRSLV